MMYLKTILIYLLTNLTTTIFCQNNLIPDSTNSYSNVTITKDSRINDLLSTYKSSYTLIGYRVQIFSDNKKQPCREEKAKFLNLYSSVKAHEIYQQPYFKVRVGDFKTKLEAYKFQKEIQAQFPNSFIVKDEIDVEELISK